MLTVIRLKLLHDDDVLSERTKRRIDVGVDLRVGVGTRVRVFKSARVVERTRGQAYTTRDQGGKGEGRGHQP